MAWLRPTFLYAVIFSCFVVASTAPTTGKRRLRATDEETRVSAIFSALSDDVKAPARSKRHVTEDAMTSELLAAIDADGSATPLQRRQRRSAVFYLTASMQFCKNYPIYCRRIEVDEGDVKVKIRLAEE